MRNYIKTFFQLIMFLFAGMTEVIVTAPLMLLVAIWQGIKQAWFMAHWFNKPWAENLEMAKQNTSQNAGG